MSTSSELRLPRGLALFFCANRKQLPKPRRLPTRAREVLLLCTFMHEHLVHRQGCTLKPGSSKSLLPYARLPCEVAVRAEPRRRTCMPLELISKCDWRTHWGWTGTYTNVFFVVLIVLLQYTLTSEVLIPKSLNLPSCRPKPMFSLVISVTSSRSKAKSQ